MKDEMKPLERESRNSEEIIDDYLRLLNGAVCAPAFESFPVSAELPLRDAAKNCALLFSPHPDDECLTGGLALRLLKERAWQVVNMAVTLGSKEKRKQARKAELGKACRTLGFKCALPEEDGFSDIALAFRDSEPEAWRKKTARVAEIIEHFQPQAIFLPHAHDWHPAHVGAHKLVMDALALMPRDFFSFIVQTEYWQPLADPDLMVGLAPEDAALLMSALACHAGEVARNPYDRRFPAYLIDNARRGCERMGGQGAASKPDAFAMLYKTGVWKQGKFSASALNKVLCADGSLGELLQ